MGALFKWLNPYKKVHEKGEEYERYLSASRHPMLFE
jgi:hypothetical protein